MALIKCPECGKEVSSAAKACPGCGFGVSDYVNSMIDCPECGKKFSKIDKTCPNCGFQVAVNKLSFSFRNHDNGDKNYAARKLSTIFNSNIKGNKKVIAGVALAIVIIAITSMIISAGKAKVSNKRIKKDMISYEVGKLVEDSNFNPFDIESVEIIKQRTQKKSKDEINCVITYRNDELDIIVPFYLEYNYYDQGWTLDNITPGEDIDFIPRKGPDDDTIKAHVNELEIYDSCVSINHDMKVAEKTDCVTVEISTNTECLSVSGTLYLNYELSNGSWHWASYSYGDDYKEDWNLVGTYMITDDDDNPHINFYSVKEQREQSIIMDTLSASLAPKDLNNMSFAYWNTNEELVRTEYVINDLDKTFMETRIPAFGSMGVDQYGFVSQRDYENDIFAHIEKISDEPTEDLYALLYEKYGVSYKMPEQITKTDVATGIAETIYPQGTQPENSTQDTQLESNNDDEYEDVWEKINSYDVELYWNGETETYIVIDCNIQNTELAAQTCEENGGGWPCYVWILDSDANVIYEDICLLYDEGIPGVEIYGYPVAISAPEEGLFMVNTNGAIPEIEGWYSICTD